MKMIFCVVLGLMAGAVVTLYVMNERARWLALLEFELHPPPVPFATLEVIQGAERQYYASKSTPRRLAEQVQDVVVFASPALANRLSFSVGRYRMKADTISHLVPWAIKKGFLTLDGTDPHTFSKAMAYFSEQPVLNDWQAAVYLEWLRLDHPMLKDLTWEAIANDLFLVAKLYSGYMGAGGDWEGWRADTMPGPVALRRLGLGPVAD